MQFRKLEAEREQVFLNSFMGETFPWGEVQERSAEQGGEKKGILTVEFTL